MPVQVKSQKKPRAKVAKRTKPVPKPKKPRY